MRVHRSTVYGLAGMFIVLVTAAPICASAKQASPASVSTGATSPTAALPSPPPAAVRTPRPGPTEVGLFADGVSGARSVPTNDWETYANSNYRFTIQYPPSWQLTESNSAGHYGPHGEPSYPLFRVTVSNPAAEQSKKIPGQNCSAAANDCPGPPPGLLSFTVAIFETGTCNVAGDLIAAGETNVGGRPAARCVVEYPNDRSRTTAFAVPLANGTYLVAEADRGNAVTSESQAVLETVIATFVLFADRLPPAQTASPPDATATAQRFSDWYAEWGFRVVLSGPSSARSGEEITYQLEYQRVSPNPRGWNNEIVLDYDIVHSAIPPEPPAALVSLQTLAGEPPTTVRTFTTGQSESFDFVSDSGTLQIVLRATPGYAGPLTVRVYVVGASIRFPRDSVSEITTEIGPS